MRLVRAASVALLVGTTAALAVWAWCGADLPAAKPSSARGGLPPEPARAGNTPAAPDKPEEAPGRVSVGADSVAALPDRLTLLWQDAVATPRSGALHALGQTLPLQRIQFDLWQVDSPVPIDAEARVVLQFEHGHAVEISQIRSNEVRIPPWAGLVSLHLEGPADRAWNISIQPLVSGALRAKSDWPLPAVGAVAVGRFLTSNFETTSPIAQPALAAPIGSIWWVHAQCDGWLVEPNGVEVTCPADVTFRAVRQTAAIRVHGPENARVVLHRTSSQGQTIHERHATLRRGLAEFFALGGGDPLPPETAFMCLARLPDGSLCRQGFLTDRSGSAEVFLPTQEARPAIRVSLPEGLTPDALQAVWLRRSGRWSPAVSGTDFEDANSTTADCWVSTLSTLIVSTLLPESAEGIVTTRDGRVGRFFETPGGTTADLTWFPDERAQLEAPAIQHPNRTVIWSLEANLDGEWVTTLSGRCPAADIAGIACHRLVAVPLRMVTREPGAAAVLHPPRFR